MPKQRKTKFFNTKALGFLHSEETLLPDSFRLFWFSFVYVIPKQRKTKFFSENTLGFLHSEESLLPNYFGYLGFPLFTSYQNKGKPNPSTQKPWVFCTAKNHFFQIHFGYLGFPILRSCQNKENQILQHKTLGFCAQQRDTSSIYFISKQRKTKFFDTKTFCFLHSKESLLPDSFQLSWFSCV